MFSVCRCVVVGGGSGSWKKSVTVIDSCLIIPHSWRVGRLGGLGDFGVAPGSSDDGRVGERGCVGEARINKRVGGKDDEACVGFRSREKPGARCRIPDFGAQFRELHFRYAQHICVCVCVGQRTFRGQ